MIYEIAGLKVEMQAHFDRLKKQSEAYKASGEPAFSINSDLYPILYSTLCECSDEQKEYIYSSAAFCREIIRHGRFFLHASAVVYEDAAYLFSAPSGMGKSTHTKMWLNEFDGSYILNDDKPVIFPDNDSIYVFGTPFAGKSDLQVNKKVKLKAICFLNQGSENKISRITGDRAIAFTLNNTYRPKSFERMNLLLDMIGQVVDNTDIFEMSCRKEPAAAIMSYKAMKGEQF